MRRLAIDDLRLAIAACCAFAGFSPFQAAGQNVPHIGYVYPAGGKAGTSFEIKIGGQNLNAVTNVFITGEGAEAAVLECHRPMNQKEFMDLRDEFRALQEKRRGAATNGTNAWTEAEGNRIEEIRARILRNPPNRQGNPAIAESVRIQVTLAANAPAGRRELRVGSPAAVSNPMVFEIGALNEVSEVAAKVLPSELNFLGNLPAADRSAGKDKDLRVSLPVVLNGQILPGQVDRYRFHGSRGEQVVAALRARSLIPYLADAVPGWFQAVVSVHDADGRQLAYNDDFQFHPDPVLCFKVPRDGEYVLEIKDAIYRGREDFIYRVELGEIPFVTGIFPLGGPVGRRTDVNLLGWNLSESVLQQEAGSAVTAFQPLQAPRGLRLSPALGFSADALPECAEKQGNDSVDRAQMVSLPVIINGRIETDGDEDVFRFDGRAGERVVVEVRARRLGSPLDSAVRLTDARGLVIAQNDDLEDRGSGLHTHHADSWLIATLPSAGAYFVHLKDVQRQGGAEHGYRLRISAPHPGFAVRFAPSAISVRAGGTVPVDVWALRQDGFTNAIELRVRDEDSGLRISGGRIPENQDHVRITMTAAGPTLSSWNELGLEARAELDGRELRGEAVPADDRMQAFAYRHLVPAERGVVWVAGDRRKVPQTPLISNELPVRIPSGGKATVRLKGRNLGRLEYALNDPPPGLSLETVITNAAGVELVLQCDASTSKGPRVGNLIVDLFQSGASSNPARPPQRGLRRTPWGVLPAIPFEIVAE